MDFTFILIIATIAFNHYLIKSRTKAWSTLKSKLMLVIPIAAFGVMTIFKFSKWDLREVSFLFITPLLLVLLDYILKMISLNSQGRDFYLKLPGSEDEKAGKEFSKMDVTMSYILIAFLVVTPIIGLSGF